mmetsp:Transcript_43032/g.96849  ORF Transcript_43032/g.96849 Transcript_43032/m.96849 type:complete len:801 (-) Transcript_43032:35-2437(-)
MDDLDINVGGVSSFTAAPLPLRSKPQPALQRPAKRTWRETQLDGGASNSNAATITTRRKQKKRSPDKGTSSSINGKASLSKQGQLPARAQERVAQKPPLATRTQQAVLPKKANNTKAEAAWQQTSSPSTAKRAKHAAVTGDAGDNFASNQAFKDMELHSVLQRQLEYLKMECCTPIQGATLPKALSSDVDFLLRAPTGSGKTLAFLLPVLHRLLLLPEKQRSRTEGVLSVVLSPTKELCLQTLKVAQNLMRMVPNFVCGAVAGGEKPKSEKARLRKGLSLLCATPGRLAYHLDHTATLDTNKVRCMVLDEADRLLDMGFEPQVRLIYRKLTGVFEDAAGAAPPPKKGRALQSYLVSATLSAGVRKLAQFCLRDNAIWVNPDGDSHAGQVGGLEEDGEDLAMALPSTLTQWYCTVPCRDRLSALIAAMLARAGEGSPHDEENPADLADEQKAKSQKAIIFFSSCASVDFHHDLFVDAAWPHAGGLTRRGDVAAPKVKRYEGGFVGLESKPGYEDDDEDMGEGEDNDEEAQQSDEEQRNSRKVFGNVPLHKLHGSLSTEERAGHINDFAKGVGGALLASDAASRGLDFPKIDWIIQYDPPQRVEEYLHRVGRTARIGRKGNALLFLQPSEMGFLDHLRDKGLKNFRELTMRSLLGVLVSKFAPQDLRGLPGLHKLLEAALRRRVQDKEALLQQARSAFFATLRAYRAIPKELRSVFPAQEIHMGHWASSFALREPPGKAVKQVVHTQHGPSGESKPQKRAAKGEGRGGRGRGSDAARKLEGARGGRRGQGGRQAVPHDEFSA